jgi:hypothetical protein
MSLLGQKAKYSIRIDVFRCSPNNGHSAANLAIAYGATSGGWVGTGERVRYRYRTAYPRERCVMSKSQTKGVCGAMPRPPALGLVGPGSSFPR